MGVLSAAKNRLGGCRNPDLGQLPAFCDYMFLVTACEFGVRKRLDCASWCTLINAPSTTCASQVLPSRSCNAQPTILPGTFAGLVAEREFACVFMVIVPAGIKLAFLFLGKLCHFF